MVTDLFHLGSIDFPRQHKLKKSLIFITNVLSLRLIDSMTMSSSTLALLAFSFDIVCSVSLTVISHMSFGTISFF